MRGRRIGAVLIVATIALGAGCAKRKARQGELALREADVLYREGMELLERRDLRKARELLQRVQYTAENRRELEPLVRLAVADATFYQGDVLSRIDARSLYLDFVTLFGDHPRAPYAQFQAGICSLSQVNDPARDQSQTLVAIQDLREVSTRYPTSPYAPVARLKIREARDLLAEHEFGIGRFYVKKKAYQAGIARFTGLLADHPEFAERDKVYYWIGEAMLRQDNFEEGRLYLEKLIADFPGSEWLDEARESLERAARERGNDGDEEPSS